MPGSRSEDFRFSGILAKVVAGSDAHRLVEQVGSGTRHPGYAAELQAIGFRVKFGNDQLRIVGTKFVVDGIMSACTAALYDPYANGGDNCRMLSRHIPLFEAKDLEHIFHHWSAIMDSIAMSPRAVAKNVIRTV